MATETRQGRTGDAGTDLSVDSAATLAEEEHGPIEGRSPWVLAWRRLRRNWVALLFLVLFVVILALCALAPVYADKVAGTTPNANHVTDKVRVNGELRDVISAGGTFTDPKTGELRVRAVTILGPTWWHAGGTFVLALLAGYFRGWVDWLITRFFDLIWAFPVILLAIALGSALAINGFHHFGLNVQAGSLWIPTFVISYVLIPYIGRPLRGQILSLREKEFVEAAIAQGASAPRIMFSEILPNIGSSVLVFFTLIIANNILAEAALSFLGAGVQPPNPSWGTLIAEGQQRITTAPWLTLVPGIAIVLTVLSLNIFGDGLRDALDPRAKVRIEH